MIEAKVILDSVSPAGKRAPQGARLKKPLKWSDVPCKKGHIGLRYDSGGCVQCSRVSEPKKTGRKPFPQPERDAAAALGLKTYEGDVCPAHPGHATRWVGNTTCTLCSKEAAERYRRRNPDIVKKARREWAANNQAKTLLQAARKRARDRGEQVEITEEDIPIPSHCPVLGIPLERGAGGVSDGSPTIDRIRNDLGYVKGNVRVISWRANKIKGDATIVELQRVVDYMKGGSPMIISATVIADSVSAAGKRITTLELTYPRYVHAEYLTHRAFSRNASSSRAVPVTKAVDLALGEMVEPIQWQKNQAGMQASSENLEGAQLAEAQAVWREAAEACAKASRRLAEIGLHKQWANRPCEWFSHIKVLCTATEWDNFFALRCHPDAQPEMQSLAWAMREAMDASTPWPTEHHFPYVREEDGVMSMWRRAMVSAARCARVSYLKHDGTAPSIGDDLALFERLAGGTPIHASPLEHQGFAMPLTGGRSRNFVGWWQFRELFEERSMS